MRDGCERASQLLRRVVMSSTNRAVGEQRNGLLGKEGDTGEKAGGKEGGATA